MAFFQWGIYNSYIKDIVNKNVVLRLYGETRYFFITARVRFGPGRGCAARAGGCVEPEASPRRAGSRRAWLARKRGETHGLDGAELMSSAESVGPTTSLVHRRVAGVSAGAFSERASPFSSVSASSNSDSSSAKSGEEGGQNRGLVA